MEQRDVALQSRRVRRRSRTTERRTDGVILGAGAFHGGLEAGCCKRAVDDVREEADARRTGFSQDLRTN